MNEKKRIANSRDEDINRRAAKVEEDLAKLEADGEPAAVRKKVRDAAEKEMNQRRKRADAEITRLDNVFDRFRTLKVQDLEGDELLFREMRDRFGKYFAGEMGAAAIQQRLRDFDLAAEAVKLKEIITTGKGQKKTRALKRLKVVSAFLNTTNSPEAMVLDYVPVIPPDLRPPGRSHATAAGLRPRPSRRRSTCRTGRASRGTATRRPQDPEPSGCGTGRRHCRAG